MARMKYLLQSINVLNGLLAAAVATVAYFTVIPFLNLDIQMSPPAAKETAEWSGEKSVLPQNYSPADYAVISEQNLFHPDRKIPPEKKDEKAIPRPDVVLYGTLITDDTSIAFIEDRKAPYSTPGRGKRQVSLKKGDNLNGYILLEIETHRIVLVKGEDKIVVMLNDGEKRKAGAAPALQATSTMPSGGAPPVIVPASSPQAVTSSSIPPTVAAPVSGGAVPVARQPSRMEALQLRLKDGQQMRREAVRTQQP
jgi:hypothetical protein